MVHMSSAEVRQQLLPHFRQLFKNDKDFRLRMAIDLDLEVEEVAFILEEKIDSNAVKHVMSDMKRVLDAKDQKMDRAIDRKKVLEVLDEDPAPQGLSRRRPSARFSEGP
jgi:hypothetical protein